MVVLARTTSTRSGTEAVPGTSTYSRKILVGLPTKYLVRLNLVVLMIVRVP